MSDMLHMLNTMVDRHGKILIPDIMEDIVPLTDEELARYKNIDFSPDEYKKEIGCNALLHNEDKV